MFFNLFTTTAHVNSFLCMQFLTFTPLSKKRWLQAYSFHKASVAYANLVPHWPVAPNHSKFEFKNLSAVSVWHEGL